MTGNQQQVNQQKRAHNTRELVESHPQPQTQPQARAQPQPPHQGGSGGGSGEGDGQVIINEINNHNHDDDHNDDDGEDVDDDILTLLSSISLSEARKYHHGRRSRRNKRIGQGLEQAPGPRYSSPSIPTYRLLLVDDRSITFTHLTMTHMPALNLNHLRTHSPTHPLTHTPCLFYLLTSLVLPPWL